MPEYQFAVEKCGCGFKLSGRKHVELTGNKGHILLGRCPKCGTTYPLVEIKSEPVNPEAEAEAKAEAQAEAEAKAKAEAEAEPEPVVKLEPGPETEPVTEPEPEPETPPVEE